jgi:hypothetical protein
VPVAGAAGDPAGARPAEHKVGPFSASRPIDNLSVLWHAHVGVEGVKNSSASEKSASLYQQTLKCFTPPSVCTCDWPALHAAQGATKASHTTPQEAEKTPTLCLFERFERLTLGVTPSTALNTAASAGAGHGTAAAAPDSAATSSSAGSEQCVARLGPGRRSVAFGTPSVLTYTPALPGKGSEEIVHDDEGTPLWSNAGVFQKHMGVCLCRDQLHDQVAGNASKLVLRICR